MSSPSALPLIHHLLTLDTLRRLPDLVAEGPDHLQIECTNRCNLRCGMCPIEELTRLRPKRKLTPTDLEGILRQVPRVREISLQGIGEPLTNAHLPELVRLGTAAGVRMGFITNGVLLDDAHCQALIEAGLDNVGISLDSPDPAIFRALRVGSELHQVAEGVSRLARWRRRLGSPHPFITLITVVTRANAGQLPRLARLARELGADRIVFKGFNPWVDPSLASPGGEAPGALLEQLAALEVPGRFGVHPAFLQEGEGRFLCRWPWRGAYVTVEGEVTPCCNCPDARVHSLGNLYREPWEEIWNGEPYRAFRAALRQGRPPLCRSCPDYAISYVHDPALDLPLETGGGQAAGFAHLAFAGVQPRYRRGERFTARLEMPWRWGDREGVRLWLAAHPPGQPPGRLLYPMDPRGTWWDLIPRPWGGEEPPLALDLPLPGHLPPGPWEMLALLHAPGIPLTPLGPGVRSNLAVAGFLLE